MKPFFDPSVRILLQVRFVRVIDLIFALAYAGLFAAMAIRAILGHVDMTELVLLGLAVLLTQIWTVLLVFRTAYYVLQCRADVNTMTADAAKMVHAYQMGAPPPNVPAPRV